MRTARISEWSLIMSPENWLIQSVPQALSFLVFTNLLSRTGDLLLNPVCPHNAPNGHLFVNMDSKDWFEAQPEWPSGNIGSHLSAFSDVAQVEEAVAQWVCVIVIFCGFCRLSPISSRCRPSTFSLCGMTSPAQERARREVQTWAMKSRSLWIMIFIRLYGICLSIQLRERCIALPIERRKADTPGLLFASPPPRSPSMTQLVWHLDWQIFLMEALLRSALRFSTDAGYLKSRSSMKPIVVHRRFYSPQTRRFSPYSAISTDTKLAAFLISAFGTLFVFLMHYYICNQFTRLCRHGLRQTGDGKRVGNIVGNGHTMSNYASANFECLPWDWQSVGAHRERERSQYLSRLDLLKELFNVFLNRAVIIVHKYFYEQLNFCLLCRALSIHLYLWFLDS
jgi:hypothetical protein